MGNTTIYPVYPTVGVSATITLNGLVSSSTNGRQSADIDNTTTKPLLQRILVTIVTSAAPAAASSPSGVYFWAAPIGLDASENEIYTGGLTANSDVAYTANKYDQLNYLGVISVTGSGMSGTKEFVYYQPPRKYSLVAKNYCGINLASAGNSITINNENEIGSS